LGPFQLTDLQQQKCSYIKHKDNLLGPFQLTDLQQQKCSYIKHKDNLLGPFQLVNECWRTVWGERTTAKITSSPQLQLLPHGSTCQHARTNKEKKYPYKPTDLQMWLLLVHPYIIPKQTILFFWNVYKMSNCSMYLQNVTSRQRHITSWKSLVWTKHYQFLPCKALNFLMQQRFKNTYIIYYLLLFSNLHTDNMET